MTLDVLNLVGFYIVSQLCSNQTLCALCNFARVHGILHIL